jgi:hypothetical protein
LIDRLAAITTELRRAAIGFAAIWTSCLEARAAFIAERRVSWIIGLALRAYHIAKRSRWSWCDVREMIVLTACNQRFFSPVNSVYSIGILEKQGPFLASFSFQHARALTAQSRFHYCRRKENVHE